MSSSGVGDFEDALLGLLLADPTLAALAGPPQLGEPQDPADEHLWISDEVEETQDVHTTGNVPTRQEDWQCHVSVFKARTGNDRAAVRDRGEQLVAILEGIIRTNFRVGGTAFFADFVGYHRTAGAWEKRIGMVWDCSIRVRNYL